MSISYGFYDAVEVNGVWDREYTASQLSQLFDGLVNDGVYESIGGRFQVTPTSPESMNIIVGSGRAWFEHTWTLNDAPEVRTVYQADASLDRIDAVCIRVDSTERTNSIVLIMGVNSSSPVKPTPENSPNDAYSGGDYGGKMTTSDHPIAYISVPHQKTAIKTDYIENAVGTSVCPFVTGIVQVMSIDQIVNQWQAQWNTWLSTNTSTFNSTVNSLENDVQTRINYLDTEIYQVEQEVGADLKPIVGYNISVAANAWSTFTATSGTEEYKIKEKGYEYRATIPLANVIPGMRPYVTWSLADVEDAGVTILNQNQCISGGVYAYADSAPSSAITALTVECRKTVT